MLEVKVGRKPDTQIPDDWEPLDSDLCDTAKHKALRALEQTGSNPAPERLAWFYDISGNYAGASFAELRPNDPWDLTATDLHATMLMSVRIGPRATRRILDESATRAGLLRKLGQVPELDLTVAGRPELSAMADFYQAVKQALSADTVKRPNPWVTASKLCARKRPGLFPVRDRKVCDYLGLSPFADYRVDWQVFRSLIADPEIITAVSTLTYATVAGAPERNLRMEQRLAAEAPGCSDLDLCRLPEVNRNAEASPRHETRSAADVSIPRARSRWIRMQDGQLISGPTEGIATSRVKTLGAAAHLSA